MTVQHAYVLSKKKQTMSVKSLDTDLIHLSWIYSHQGCCV